MISEHQTSQAYSAVRAKQPFAVKGHTNTIKTESEVESASRENSNQTDDYFIDNVASASYAAGIEFADDESNISESPIASYESSTDENAIDKVASASYAAFGIEFECDDELPNITSAPEVESVEEAEARAQILADAAALEKSARDYMHPENHVVVTDPTATARCYFDHASAPEVESVEETEARAQALADAAALEKLARDYMHPENHVVVIDPTTTARCYFDHASAPSVESVEETEARVQILADAVALEKLANDCMHPESHIALDDPNLADYNPSTGLISFSKGSITTVHAEDEGTRTTLSYTEQFDHNDAIHERKLR
jgi:hypothetical protein